MGYGAAIRSSVAMASTAAIGLLLGHASGVLGGGPQVVDLIKISGVASVLILSTAAFIGPSRLTTSVLAICAVLIIGYQPYLDWTIWCALAVSFIASVGDRTRRRAWVAAAGAAAFSVTLIILAFNNLSRPQINFLGHTGH